MPANQRDSSNFATARMELAIGSASQDESRLVIP